MQGSFVFLVMALLLSACAASTAVPTASAGPSEVGPAAPSAAAGGSAPSSSARPLGAVTGYPAADAGVLFLILGSQLFRYDGRTGEVRQVGSGAQFAASSSTGAYVVPFGGPASLFEWDGTKKELDCGVLLRGVSISASGDCAGIRGDLSLTIEQRGGTPHMVIPPGGGAIAVAWSPDGTELALIKRADQFENSLWVIRPGAATSITVVDVTQRTRTSVRCPAGDATAARWSADGGRLLLLCHERGSDESELRLYTMGRGTTRLLTLGTRTLIDLFEHLAWSMAAR